MLGLAFPASAADTIDFDKQPTYAFGSFSSNVEVADGSLRIRTPNGQGGAGFQQSYDLSGDGDRLPLLRVTLGPEHRGRRLIVEFKDADDNMRAFSYDLRDLQRQKSIAVSPQDAQMLMPPPGEAFDPASVKQMLVKGDWGSGPFDVTIEAVEVAAATPEQAAEWQESLAKLEKKRQQQAQREQQRIERRDRLLEEGADHPADGPRVTAVSTLGPTLLAIRLHEREAIPGGQTTYEPQPDDQIRPDGRKVLVWRDGKPVIESMSQKVFRKRENGKREEIGRLLADGRTLRFDPSTAGTSVTMETLDSPEAYVVRSDDDSAFSSGVTAVALHRKSKPIGNLSAERQHWIYLELPSPLADGRQYTIDFYGINTAEPSVDFVYDSTQMWSPAVQATHVGHRPNDPFKRAFLSEWLGSGGAHTFDVDEFELLDEQGNVVFTGPVERVLAADESENLAGSGNRTGTNVYALDYADFAESGMFRVHVPGVGVSRPFPIRRDAWTDAFTHVMKGLLAHRSGMTLPPELIGYDRPRPMHPDDGFTVFQADVTTWDGESKAIYESLKRLLGDDLDASKLDVVPDAWGGYQDAGDWDRRANHLSVTYGLLELYAMFPDYFANLPLTLPKDETHNALPDLLDEALWNAEFYRRLQREDGGVRGGIESTAHPRSGEASWQESLLAAAFEPDPQASYDFAAVAAKLSGLLAAYDVEAAAEWHRDAVHAWNWAQANGDEVIAAAQARSVRKADGLPDKVRNAKALAAAELYRLTEEATYHDAFKEAFSLKGDGQLSAGFAYATLSPDLADPDLAADVRSQAIAAAETTVAFGSGNAYGISHRVQGLPMMGWVGYYSVPEAILGPTLPRAHYLTGDERFLAAALRATNYAVGANPTNMTMTTGLGHDFPRHPLHVDSRATGQEPPPGIVVYGPHDPDRAPGYIKRFTLQGNLFPDVDQWPPAETYIDVGNWVEMNEYTVHQTIGPSSFYWGYLAAREADELAAREAD
jgi:endoglucanase